MGLRDGRDRLVVRLDGAARREVALLWGCVDFIDAPSCDIFTLNQLVGPVFDSWAKSFHLRRTVTSPVVDALLALWAAAEGAAGGGGDGGTWASKARQQCLGWAVLSWRAAAKEEERSSESVLRRQRRKLAIITPLPPAAAVPRDVDGTGRAMALGRQRTHGTHRHRNRPALARRGRRQCGLVHDTSNRRRALVVRRTTGSGRSAQARCTPRLRSGAGVGRARHRVQPRPLLVVLPRAC